MAALNTNDCTLTSPQLELSPKPIPDETKNQQIADVVEETIEPHPAPAQEQVKVEKSTAENVCFTTKGLIA